ncbi:hypothetical protein [Haliangium ochraceum]|uniref:FtsH ternary system domain-containing protein n=1 Tax=Haliangium ochraceum (strain DSM 14365 / JCM 11303 / SMP-2) TaxID=502025 RepID=D0LHH0_HALO1|nr:hypothetical protein [Haliangium ochraceum]ACY12832.1 hypothetical protein Hoch_0191 [Haliangium ochraceum DSM 14365]
MATRVRFRFNKTTGEVEEFLVDDQDRNLPESEHDRIAGEVARMVAVRPHIEPVSDETAAAMPDTDNDNDRDRDSDGDRADERDADALPEPDRP